MRFVEAVAQSHLQTVLDILQRTVNSDLEVLSRGLCEPFELGPGKPWWDVFHCESRSVGGVTPSL